jgi:hypothetical protein
MLLENRVGSAGLDAVAGVRDPKDAPVIARDSLGKSALAGRTETASRLTSMLVGWNPSR